MSERKLEKLLHLCNNFPINHFFNPQSRRRKNVFNISWNQSLCPKLRIFANFIWFQRRAHVRSWSNKTESVIYLKQLHRQHRHRLWTLYFCFNFPPFFLSQYIPLRFKYPKWANKRYIVQNQILYKLFLTLNRRPLWKRSDPGHVMWYVTHV